MSYLLAKSKTNHESARLLQANKKYCSAAHSAYYSCVQLMKHYLLQMGDDDASIEANKKILSKSASRLLGTHECIIIMVKDHIKAKKGYAYGRDFNTNIQTLKSYRVDSDYKNEEFQPRKGQESVILCDSINKFITNIL